LSDVSKQIQVDWDAVRLRARQFPQEAYQFVREGLAHTVKMVHGKLPDTPIDPSDESRHVSGQQLCMGLKDLAVLKYGLLARTVLNHWGIRSTADFGTLVYSLIDRGELRSSSRDSIEDFKDVFDFADAFPTAITSS
jgi:uncharacterized repeat protein (TIGR04138 family)